MEVGIPETPPPEVGVVLDTTPPEVVQKVRTEGPNETLRPPNPEGRWMHYPVWMHSPPRNASVNAFTNSGCIHQICRNATVDASWEASFYASRLTRNASRECIHGCILNATRNASRNAQERKCQRQQCEVVSFGLCSGCIIQCLAVVSCSLQSNCFAEHFSRSPLSAYHAPQQLSGL